jgi:uncharacterized LabA/DUF88 family protein
MMIGTKYFRLFPIGDSLPCFKGVSMERSAVFIDGGYLSYVLLDEFDNKKIDFEKLSKKIADGDNLLRTYYYNCEPWQSSPPTPEESRKFAGAQRFYSALRNLPNFEVRLGRLAYRGIRDDGSPILDQKGVDIHLAVDLLRLSYNKAITKAYLITNDSDFIPAIKDSKDSGVQIVLVHGKKPQINLRESVDNLIQIDETLINNCSL